MAPASTCARPDPALVILGGPENRDCDGLYDDIATLQRSSGTGTPRVILLSNRNGTTASLCLPALVDEVVAKPITSERLQPIVDRLPAAKRNAALPFFRPAWL